MAITLLGTSTRLWINVSKKNLHQKTRGQTDREIKKGNTNDYMAMREESNENVSGGIILIAFVKLHKTSTFLLKNMSGYYIFFTFSNQITPESQ